MTTNERAAELMGEVEERLQELASIWQPPDVLAYVERLAERMREELGEAEA